MKKYINAELQIVRVANDVIATSTIGIGDAKNSGNWNAQAPDRRRSIWD